MNDPVIKFKNASGSNDDKCKLNDSDEFSRSFRVIYPNKLQLKCEHHELYASFVYLDITVIDGIYEYKLSDKRDNYSLFICRTQDLSGNILAYIRFLRFNS